MYEISIIYIDVTSYFYIFHQQANPCVFKQLSYDTL